MAPQVAKVIGEHAMRLLQVIAKRPCNPSLSELFKLGNEWESALRRTLVPPRARLEPHQQGDSQAPREPYSCLAWCQESRPHATRAVVTSTAEAEGQTHYCSEKSRKRHLSQDSVQITPLPKWWGYHSASTYPDAILGKKRESSVLER